MKCKNCNCKVSSEFQHAFETNCCPKCGQTLMLEDVKSMFLKITNLLENKDNDIGDVAIWLVDTFKQTAQLSVVDEQIVATTVPLVSQPDETNNDIIKNPNRKPPAKIARSAQTTDKEQFLLPPDRANLFSKRAGVDKLKYKTIVKDIQGDINSQSSSDDYDLGSAEGGDDKDFVEYDGTPLSHKEIQSMSNLFEDTTDNQSSFLEIEKLQKLEQLAINGSVGKIRRSS